MPVVYDEREAHLWKKWACRPLTLSCILFWVEGFPWDREVEFFEARGRQADLRVTRTKMTLREALMEFLELSTAQQGAAGIGLHEPVRTMVDGREAFIGWFNAEACRNLARLLPDQ